MLDICARVRQRVLLFEFLQSKIKMYSHTSYFTGKNLKHNAIFSEHIKSSQSNSRHKVNVFAV